MEQKTLGRRIREERLKLNLTQEKLAEDVDLSMAYIGQIERGELAYAIFETGWASRWITCSRIPSLPKTMRNT